MNAIRTPPSNPIALAATLALCTPAFGQQSQPQPGRVYELGEVTLGPITLRSNGLRLPAGFDRAAVRDTVVITFVVDTAGVVDSASVVIVRPGDALVRTALIAMVLQTTYSPGMLRGTRVPVRIKRQFPLPPFPVVPITPIATIRARVRALAGEGPFQVPPLHHRYQRREYCEGDYCGCNYGTWRATTRFPAFPEELDTVRAAFQLDSGQSFEATLGYYHVLRPAVVIVLDTVRESVYRPPFVPGDTLYLLQYTGELNFLVWHRDSVVEAHQFWAPAVTRNPRGALVQTGVEEWWVPIRTTDGRRGWIRPRDPTSIRGLNRYCIPEPAATIW